jgi:hypothetical protein
MKKLTAITRATTALRNDVSLDGGSIMFSFCLNAGVL